MTANRFQCARFLTSASRLHQAPADQGREVAFAGRSNAGKSSALNAIVEQRALARISKTPGRTRMINFFAVGDEGIRLVDLPGYGYAQVSQAVRERWQRELALYLERRESLKGLILLMDIRHILKDSDCHMLDWAHRAALPAHVLLTKADKLSRGAASSTRDRCARDLATLHPAASVQLFSALKRTGIDQVRATLEAWLLPREGDS